MRKIIKRLLGCAVVLTLAAAMLAKAADITEMKLSRTKFHNFFEHAEEFDVLFLGSSHMVNGVYPLELWHDYGITSFNLGSHASKIPTTYWEYMNALDYADPDVVVIDCMSLGSLRKTADRFSMVHRALDVFPLTPTKIKAARDLTDDPVTEKMIEDGLIEDSERRSAFSLLWNFSVFHARWSELTEECKSHNRQAVLIYLPYPATKEEDWIDSNTIFGIAEEYGVPYINFMEEDAVDFRTDCYDADSHLNPSGAFKVTDYLGRWLTENCRLEDHRPDPAYSHWNDDYALYENEKNARLAEIPDLNTYLMLLEDDLYGFQMEVGDTRIFQDETTAALLQNKGFDIRELTDGAQRLYVDDGGARVENKAGRALAE